MKGKGRYQSKSKRENAAYPRLIPKSNRWVTYQIIFGVYFLLIIIGTVYYLKTQYHPPSQIIPPNVASSPTVKNDAKTSWTSYYDSSYNYTIKYPKDWTLKQEKDSEGSARIRLTNTSTATTTSDLTRTLPEIYITVASPYSTSGAVGANEFSSEEPSPLNLEIMGRNLIIPIIAGSVIKRGEKYIEFYTFSFPLPDKKVFPQEYTEPVNLNALGSYKTKEEGHIITSILSTLTY